MRHSETVLLSEKPTQSKVKGFEDKNRIKGLNFNYKYFMLQLVNAYKFSAQPEQSPFFHQKKMNLIVHEMKIFSKFNRWDLSHQDPSMSFYSDFISILS